MKSAAKLGKSEVDASFACNADIVSSGKTSAFADQYSGLLQPDHIKKEPGSSDYSTFSSALNMSMESDLHSDADYKPETKTEPELDTYEHAMDMEMRHAPEFTSENDRGGGSGTASAETNYPSCTNLGRFGVHALNIPSDCDNVMTENQNMKSQDNCIAAVKIGTCSDVQLGRSTGTGDQHYLCGVCGATLRCTDGLKEHMLSHKQETGPFLCKFCRVSYSRSQDLTAHLRLHTGEKPFKCATCRASFSWRSQLTVHLRTHSGVKPFKCTTCSASFVDYNLLKGHMLLHREERGIPCNVCGAYFRQPHHLKRHMQSHAGESPFQCEVCGKVFPSRESLKTHSQIHTSERPFVCERCGSSFVNISELLIHMRTHTGEKPFACGACGQCFTRSALLIKHMRTHFGVDSNRYKCQVCYKTYPMKCRMRTHMSTIHAYQEVPHAKPKSQQLPTGTASKSGVDHVSHHKENGSAYECDDNDKTSAPASSGVCETAEPGDTINLNTQHELPKGAACSKAANSVSGESFANSGQIVALPVPSQNDDCLPGDTQIRTQSSRSAPSDEQSQFCGICVATFTCPDDLKQHLLTHKHDKTDKTRPFLCNFCGVTYMRSHDLRAHLRTHTGEKPFKCDACGMLFAFRSHLTVHLRTHSGVRPFKCSACSSSFADYISLKVHMVSHKDERGNTCPICGAFFKQRSYLEYHMRSHTGVRPFSV